MLVYLPADLHTKKNTSRDMPWGNSISPRNLLKNLLFSFNSGGIRKMLSNSESDARLIIIGVPETIHQNNISSVTVFGKWHKDGVNVFEARIAGLVIRHGRCEKPGCQEAQSSSNTDC